MQQGGLEDWMGSNASGLFSQGMADEVCVCDAASGLCMWLGAE